MEVWGWWRCRGWLGDDDQWIRQLAPQILAPNGSADLDVEHCGAIANPSVLPRETVSKIVVEKEHCERTTYSYMIATRIALTAPATEWRSCE